MKRLGNKDLELIGSVLKKVVQNRELVGKILDELDLSLPNVKTKTMGGKVLWKDVASASGWRVQRNKILGNCRILNPENRRVAWGGKKAMIRAFKKVAEL